MTILSEADVTVSWSRVFCTCCFFDDPAVCCVHSSTFLLGMNTTEQDNPLLCVQGSLDLLLGDVISNKRLRGEWPLAEVSQGTINLDLVWMGAMQRGRFRHVMGPGGTDQEQQQCT